MKKPNELIDKTVQGFYLFEKVITILLSIIIGMVILFSLIRISVQFYDLFLAEIDDPTGVSFVEYQDLFGKIMTLLISIEFLNSILRVFRSHSLKILVTDVIMITALAVARKLIVLDYDTKDPMHIFAYGGILLAIGVFYYLVKKQRSDDKKSDLRES